MVITLNNKKNIELKWSFLMLEYLEEYPGGLKQLERDMKMKKNPMKIQNFFLYATVRSNYDEPLSYQDAIRLINSKDLERINDFVIQNFEEQEIFKKKQQNYTRQRKRKK